MATKPPADLFHVEHRITAADRQAMNGHRGGILWLTGLSGSGKTTLALALEQLLHLKGYQVYVLDGDNIRGGLNADLGFSPEDRDENIRRIGQVAALFAEAGIIAITAFISPYAKERRGARAVDPDGFREVYVKADLETCERRDPKGLYKKARRGQIADFTGVSAPYEIPENPDFIAETGSETVANSVAKLLAYVDQEFGAADTVDRVA